MIHPIHQKEISHDPIGIRGMMNTPLMNLVCRGLIPQSPEYVWVKKNDCFLRLDTHNSFLNPCIVSMEKVEVGIHNLRKGK